MCAAGFWIGTAAWTLLALLPVLILTCRYCRPKSSPGSHNGAFLTACSVCLLYFGATLGPGLTLMEGESTKSLMEFFAALPQKVQKVGFVIKVPHSAYFYSRIIGAGQMEVDRIPLDALSIRGYDFAVIKEDEMDRMTNLRKERFEIAGALSDWLILKPQPSK
jgi:hypothetical protein